MRGGVLLRLPVAVENGQVPEVVAYQNEGIDKEIVILQKHLEHPDRFKKAIIRHGEQPGA